MLKNNEVISQVKANVVSSSFRSMMYKECNEKIHVVRTSIDSSS